MEAATSTINNSEYSTAIIENVIDRSGSNAYNSDGVSRPTNGDNSNNINNINVNKRRSHPREESNYYQRRNSFYIDFN